VGFFCFSLGWGGVSSFSCLLIGYCDVVESEISITILVGQS